MLKIALTGADGLVGSRIVELLQHTFDFIPLPQTQMDITNIDQVNRTIKGTDFDIFLHLAGYTNVTGAEKNKDLTFKINKEGTENVFNAVKEKNKKFIYISTDFIFDGKNPPYFENSTPNPLGTYSLSKYQGEQLLKNQAMIVRISYPYRTDFGIKKDFFRTFKSLLEEKKALTLMTDSLMTPTFIDDIAFGLKYLFNNFSSEIYHLVGSKTYSPYEIAVLIADKFDLDKNLIKQTTFSEYIKTRPGTPKLSDIRSTKNNFYKMKNFEEGLQEIKVQMSNLK